MTEREENYDDGSRWSGIYPPGNRTVWEEEIPEVGRIYGPKGELISIVRARPKRKIGFRPDGD